MFSFERVGDECSLTQINNALPIASNLILHSDLNQSLYIHPDSGIVNGRVASAANKGGVDSADDFIVLYCDKGHGSVESGIVKTCFAYASSGSQNKYQAPVFLIDVQNQLLFECRLFQTV